MKENVQEVSPEAEGLLEVGTKKKLVERISLVSDDIVHNKFENRSENENNAKVQNGSLPDSP
ncbi:2647_t:CDS:2 [Cetraspora pellucida]|uniref:2647_t:CDS:1 n=1 Tax=Cetraspora pellucida TaxID=1433469 RepID=A0ACA9RF43_9GLOM|nr:2647_t:CDS:2 [Cetraspora pellucida]